MPAKKMSNFPRKISTVLTELDQLRGTVTYRNLEFKVDPLRNMNFGLQNER